MPIIFNPFPSFFGDGSNTTTNSSNWFFRHQILFPRILHSCPKSYMTALTNVSPSAEIEHTKNSSSSSSSSSSSKEDSHREHLKTQPTQSKFDSASQGLKDILWEQAGSIYQPPLLTQLEISKEKSDIEKNNEPVLAVEESVTLVNEHDICVVCLEEYTCSQELRNLTCHHFFHRKCIDEWFLSSSNHSYWKVQDYLCPVCKAVIQPNTGKISYVQFKVSQRKSPSSGDNQIPTISFLRAGENLVSSSIPSTSTEDMSNSIFFKKGRIYSSKQQEMQRNGLAMLLMLASATDDEEGDPHPLFFGE